MVPIVVVLCTFGNEMKFIHFSRLKIKLFKSDDLVQFLWQ